MDKQASRNEEMPLGQASIWERGNAHGQASIWERTSAGEDSPDSPLATNLHDQYSSYMLHLDSEHSLTDPVTAMTKLL